MNSSLFVTWCSGEMAQEPSWHLDCWLSLHPDDGALSSFLRRDDAPDSPPGSVRTCPSNCSLSGGPLLVSSSSCDVLKNTDLWPLNSINPWGVSYFKVDWVHPNGNSTHDLPWWAATNGVTMSSALKHGSGFSKWEFKTSTCFVLGKTLFKGWTSKLHTD